MNIFRYSNILNRSIFMSDVLELKIPDSSIISDIVEETDEYPLISIANFIRGIIITPMDSINVEQLYNYYKDLAIAICQSINKEYDNDTINIIAAYIFPETTLGMDAVNEILPLFENIAIKNIDDNDEVWFMIETIRYKLLSLYTQTEIDKIRELLPIIKENKNKYDNFINKFSIIE